MHLRIVFFPFLLRFIEILESHWLISLISFRKFPNIAFFQILLFPHSLVFFLCVPIIFILNLFIMSLSLFCVFSFFFLCVYHFGNLLLLCLLNYYCSFQQVQSIVIINLSISLFLLLYFPHSFFFSQTSEVSRFFLISINISIIIILCLCSITQMFGPCVSLSLLQTFLAIWSCFFKCLLILD